MLLCRILLFYFLILPSLSLFASSSNNNKSITVRFATNANYYPFEYFNEKNEIQGFDIDIARAICNVADLICSFHHQSFDSILTALQINRFDAAISAIDITEARLQKVDFSYDYYREAPVFVSSILTEENFSIENNFIGVQARSSNQDYLMAHIKQNTFIIPYFSSTEAFNDLKKHKIDTVFVDHAVATAFLQNENNQKHFSIKHTEDLFRDEFSKGYGIAIKKGNKELQERLNLGIKIILANGDYQQIYTRYFG